MPAQAGMGYRDSLSKEDTLTINLPGPSQLGPFPDWCVHISQMMGIFRTKPSTWECLFACQFPECFSNFPLRHSDAFVSLLLGINGEEGLEVGQHSVLALPLAVFAQWGGSQTSFSLALQLP